MLRYSFNNCVLCVPDEGSSKNVPLKLDENVISLFYAKLHDFKRPCSVVLPGRPSEDVPFSFNEEAVGAGKTGGAREGGGGQSLAGSVPEDPGCTTVLSSSI